MSTVNSRAVRSRSRSALSSPVVLAGLAVCLCVVLDLVIVAFTQAGAPAGKGSVFFYELALLLGGSGLMATLLVLYPAFSRTLVPGLLMVLAWHTGLQLRLSAQSSIIISAVDIFVPVLVVFGLLYGWNQGAATSLLTRLMMKRFAIFGLFALWGLALGLIRAADVAAMLMNFKAFLLYPFLALIIMWSITSWRMLYQMLALQVALILERSIEAIVHPSTLTTILDSGQIVSRANGNFASVNQFAFYIMSGTLLVVALIVASKSKRLQFVLTPVLLVMSVAILLTLSRGAWLATVMGLAAIALLLGARRVAALAALLVMVVFAVQVAQPQAAQLVAGRLTSRYGQSIQTRQDYLQLGIVVVEHYPFGAGWGAAFTDGPAGLQADHNPDTDWPWYHNDYLQLATEVGVVGLAVFLWIWFTLLRLGVGAARRAERGLQFACGIGLVAAVIGMLAQALTDQFFWRTDIAPHVWIVGGLLLAFVTLVRSPEPAPNPGESRIA